MRIRFCGENEQVSRTRYSILRSKTEGDRWTCPPTAVHLDVGRRPAVHDGRPLVFVRLTDIAVSKLWREQGFVELTVLLCNQSDIK